MNHPRELKLGPCDVLESRGHCYNSNINNSNSRPTFNVSGPFPFLGKEFTSFKNSLDSTNVKPNNKKLKV